MLFIYFRVDDGFIALKKNNSKLIEQFLQIHVGINKPRNETRN